MFRWLRSPRQPSLEDDRLQLSDRSDEMMSELVLNEIEAHIVDFENEKEQRQSQINLQEKIPDYRWLISAHSESRPKKYLTMQERNRLERACELVLPKEWSKLVTTFKCRIKSAATRCAIIETFVMCVHETILARPRKVSVSDVMKRYTRSGSSINAVGDSPRPLETNRSLTDICLRDISDIV